MSTMTTKDEKKKPCEIRSNDDEDDEDDDYDDDDDETCGECDGCMMLECGFCDPCRNGRPNDCVVCKCMHMITDCRRKRRRRGRRRGGGGGGVGGDDGMKIKPLTDAEYSLEDLRTDSNRCHVCAGCERKPCHRCPPCLRRDPRNCLTRRCVNVKEDDDEVARNKRLYLMSMKQKDLNEGDVGDESDVVSNVTIKRKINVSGNKRSNNNNNNNSSSNVSNGNSNSSSSSSNYVYGGRSTAAKTRRCGECEGCTRDDCGDCNSCKDKPKFGGKGTKKQACFMRTCHVKANEKRKRKYSKEKKGTQLYLYQDEEEEEEGGGEEEEEEHLLVLLEDGSVLPLVATQ